MFRRVPKPAVLLPLRSILASSYSSTAGKVIRCKAAVAWKPNAPLSVETIEVAPPKAGEVRVKVIANALCHTDLYTLNGEDPEGLFPCILGHEAGAIVESVGPGVTSVQPGDHVIPCYTPECQKPECIFCESPKTNLCPEIRATQGKGVMPDGTSRFSINGQPLYHFMGCSTFSEYSVIAEISAAKIDPSAPLDTMCLFGCGISTGFGAVFNTTKVEPGSSVAVFGIGAVGLAVIQAAKQAGASRIFAIDPNPAKFRMATQLGATDCIGECILSHLYHPSVHLSSVAESCGWWWERLGTLTSCFVDPTASDTPIQQILVETTKWGVDYTYDCTGNTEVGFHFECYYVILRTAFGGYKSRTQVPQLVKQSMEGKLPIDHFITHKFQGVDAINDAIKALKSGNCLRAVVTY
ncbi:hypothetical protein DYB28_000282 [Aphanomyces astaci]|uniref:Enoyl reductase (ER) domain-containing protein n=1 Tax=Aphanomyces astaci TaxID=112090 RepID=A0A397AUM6_APHAT|nr:hypothetical protein DYB36_000492 [Aphanomyces astaci]RHY16965.1 hypothetical protein DYB25_000217 [Aphanomyces astaci]RHY50296.1 hypothetical protein DYB30_000636 [Aphanomyces astaci]RHY60359.1 hypothetical protein DYB38_000183 [Aphanomyces astaci]RHY65137.1 hypothetical protein DYB34_000417 [Aphanomyces astaci]